jgi:hypothetical protein
VSTVTVAELRAEVGIDGDDTSQDARLTRSLLAGKLLLDRYVERNLIDPSDAVPDEIYELAHLRIAVDDFNRSQAPNGMLEQQFDDPRDGAATPRRVSTDPYRTVRHLLFPWCADDHGTDR